MKVRVTHRVNAREVVLPFHWGGVYEGESLEDRYPEGRVPYAIGDRANITVPGYDSEIQLQETELALVRVRKATPDLLEELDTDTDLLDEFPQDRGDIGLQKDYDVRDERSVR